MTKSEFNPPITDPESEELHRAVAESVIGVRYDLDTGALLARLLRSDHELHPRLRCWLADALEGKAPLRLSFRRAKPGPPTSTWMPVVRALRNVAIADFMLERIELRAAEGHAVRGLQKAAIGEAMKEFGLGETAVKDAYAKGKNAAVEFRQQRQPGRTDHQFRIIG